MRRFFSMRFLSPLLIVLALALMSPAILAAMQEAPPSAGTQLLTWIGTAIGFAGVALTGVAKKLVAKLDAAISGGDGKLVAFYKPWQPVIAMALGLVLVKLNILGVTGDQAAAAPIGVGVGITVRELLVRLSRALGFA